MFTEQFAIPASPSQPNGLAIVCMRRRAQAFSNRARLRMLNGPSFIFLK